MPAVAIKFRFLSTAFPWIASTAAAISTSLQCVPVESAYSVSCVVVQSTAYTPSCVATDPHGLYSL